ncbi:MAG: hypothetical protein HYV09_25600 [Deltaproteobacteria bacterium]|nr:hypothetical protein [Deltaproteobacteria bacterium]
MTRWSCVAFLGLSPFLASGCSPHDGDEYERGYGRGYAPACHLELTCGTCTPVLGCGWCQYEDGSGRCATGPQACGDNFRWNWEPPSCPASGGTPVDAGVEPPPADAAPSTDAPSTDAASPDAPSTDAPSSDAPSADDAPASDAPPATDTATCGAPPSLPAACRVTFGGSLCGAGQYSLACTGSTAPAGCKAALTEGTTTHYCCSCE